MTLARYAAAVLAVVLTVAARLGMADLVGNRLPYLPFIFPVIGAAAFWGLGPAALAVALSILSAWYFFIPSYFSFLVADPVDLVGLAMFAASCAAIVAFSEANRAARRRMERETAERVRAEGVIAQDSLLLANVRDSVIVTDLQGIVTFWNKGAERLLGWTAGEMLGRPMVDRLPEGSRAESAAWLRRIAEGEAFDGEWLDHRKDGSPVWIRAHARLIRDATGRPLGLMGVSHDITERKQAEAALRESERRLLQLADTMPQIVWTAGSDGVIDYFNRRCYEYTGLTPESLLGGDGWQGSVHPDDLPVLRPLREAAIGEGGLFEAEVRLRRRDGAYRWHLLRSAPILDDRGLVARRFGTATDIDDLKRAEEALREREEQYRAVYSQLAAGVAETDLDGTILRANDRYCELLGRCRDEILGRRFAEFTHPDDLGGNLDQFRSLVAGGPSFTIEKRYVRKDGTPVWTRMSVSLIRDARGAPARTAGVVEDITERKRLEGELGRRLGELAEADRRKDEFLATLAHELRNPLAPIRTALHLMRRPDGDEHEAERAMAERQVVHLARLVDDLMDVARISKGTIRLRTQPVELAPVVNRAVEAVQSSILGRDQALAVSLPPGPIVLEADPTRLEQILCNLLTNAVKYTDIGGQIRLEAERDGDEVEIRVRDTGIGIEPGMLGRIFEMFVQVDRRSVRSQGGLGIGLGLVKAVVEQHGGRVEARSGGIGAGSEFVVRLPLAAGAGLGLGASGRLPSAATTAERPPRPAPPGTPQRPARRRILVVDDNTDAADSLARLMARRLKQEVRVAYDGPSALELAAEFEPEVVVLDIGMPLMDGFEVARRLRRDPKHSGVLLIALTGWGQEADRQLTRAAGFDHHLVKPAEPDAIRDIVMGNGPGAPRRPPPGAPA